MTRDRIRTGLFLGFALAGMVLGFLLWTDRISIRRLLRQFGWWDAFLMVSRVHSMFPHPLIQALQLVLGLACLALFIWLLSQARQQQRAPIDKRP